MQLGQEIHEYGTQIMWIRTHKQLLQITEKSNIIGLFQKLVSCLQKQLAPNAIRNIWEIWKSLHRQIKNHV